MPTPTTFARRWNSDGSIDSICYSCYRTVASARTEVELQWAEQQQHDCVPLATQKQNRQLREASLCIHVGGSGLFVRCRVIEYKAAHRTHKESKIPGL